MAQPPTRPSGPFRPTRLGQWEVIAKIAGGGMSAVYLGRKVGDAESGRTLEDTSTPPQVVALKIVRHDVRDERLLKMFLEEGKLIARLVHPNIVRTLEVGADVEQDFIAMELMLGKTFAAIHDTMAQRDVRLNPEIAAYAAARIADALHYAHELTDERGQPLALVHRDVNPANVFATFQGEVKLFDFGLAKVTSEEGSGSHMLAGKLSYLSPEQIMQLPLDRRSDVFSLGTTLWELLTGKRLFRRESDIDTVRAVQLGPIPDPRTVIPEIPEELARITKTALERNREHRYPTGAYLARELDAFLYARTSPNDVAARLAQLVDTIFPGEQKRQSGWLKPAVSGSISRASGPTSMRGGPLSSKAGPISKAQPKRSLSPHEITAVMPNAPQKPGRSGSSASIGDAPLTETVVNAHAQPPPAAYGSATNIAVAPPHVPPPTDSSPQMGASPLDPLQALESLERTSDVGSPPVSSGSAQPPGSNPPSTARSLPPITPRSAEGSLPPSRPSNWPVSGVPPRITPSVLPPPPQRTRTSVAPRGPSIPPPPTPQSKTDVEVVIPAPAPVPTAAAAPAPAPQSIRPPMSLPSGRGGLPRKPIPLPSSKKSIAPPGPGSSAAAVSPVAAASSRKSITDPPDSDTQVDIPAPPNNKDKKR